MQRHARSGDCTGRLAKILVEVPGMLLSCFFLVVLRICRSRGIQSWVSCADLRVDMPNPETAPLPSEELSMQWAVGCSDSISHEGLKSRFGNAALERLAIMQALRA